MRGVDPDGMDREERSEYAHHEDFRVGEVDEPQNPIDQRVPQGDQGIDRPEGHAVHR